jgi:hypothetical protein
MKILKLFVLKKGCAAVNLKDTKVASGGAPLKNEKAMKEYRRVLTWWAWFRVLETWRLSI